MEKSDFNKENLDEEIKKYIDEKLKDYVKKESRSYLDELREGLLLQIVNYIMEEKKKVEENEGYKENWLDEEPKKEEPKKEEPKKEEPKKEEPKELQKDEETDDDVMTL